MCLETAVYSDLSFDFESGMVSYSISPTIHVYDISEQTRHKTRHKGVWTISICECLCFSEKSWSFAIVCIVYLFWIEDFIIVDLVLICKCKVD